MSLRRMRRDKEWGDHVCLQAWADRMGGSVVVHFRGGQLRHIDSGAVDGPEYHELFSGRADKGHYTALRKSGSDSEASEEPARKVVRLDTESDEGI